MNCTKCHSENIFKSGFVREEQRFKCKTCGRQFVPTRHKGKSETDKLTAVLLYINGLSLCTIARLFKVTPPAVLKWIKKFAYENYEKAKPKSEAVIIELDEMWHYLKSKKPNCGYGRLIVVLPVNSLTGNVGIVIEQRLKDCSNE